MCYSAMLKEQWRDYQRLTGAEIDLAQFAELIGMTLEDPSIRIARFVERWFDKPATSEAHRIHDLFAQRRSQEVTKLEQELFALRKRLADAERKLAEKPTKAATESKRIATDKSERALARLNRLKDPKAHASDARIFPMNYAPIIMKDGDHRVVRLARYHCRPEGKPASVDRQFPGLYNARRDNLEKYWRDHFAAKHALMLVDSFYENVDRDGKNAVLHFVPRPADTMLIACLYSQWKGPTTGESLLSFAAITDEPPAEVAAAGHDRMIINIKPENVDAWLAPAGRSREELQAILNDRQAPYYEHEVMAA